MHHWTQTLGQKFNLKPTAEMVSRISLNENFIKRRNVSLKGESKLACLRTELRDIEYDRQFLIEFIAYHLSGIFEAMETKDAQKLFYEARRHWKEQSRKS